MRCAYKPGGTHSQRYTPLSREEFNKVQIQGLGDGAIICQKNHNQHQSCGWAPLSHFHHHHVSPQKRPESLFFFMEYQYRKSCSVSKIIYIYKRKVGNSGMQNFPFENVISTFGIPILLPHWGSKCAAQIHISAVEGHMVVVSRGGIIGTWYPHICIETQSYSRLKTFNEFLASEFVLFLRRVNSTLYLYTVFPFWTPHVIDHKWSH